MLFEQYKYDTYRFPQPQYLGAKARLGSWILRFIPPDISTAPTVLDAFGGSQSIAYLLKQQGYRVLTNDFLSFNHHIGLSLIENKSETLTPVDIEMLFEDSKVFGDLMQAQFSNVFFESLEAECLDKFRGNVERLDSVFKRALALTVMNRSLTRKVIMGHFAHNQALSYAANAERVRRNPSIAKPIQEIFLSLVPDYNRAVFDNGQSQF